MYIHGVHTCAAEADDHQSEHEASGLHFFVLQKSGIEWVGHEVVAAVKLLRTAKSVANSSTNFCLVCLGEQCEKRASTVVLNCPVTDIVCPLVEWGRVCT